MVETRPMFDPDFGPEHEINKKAARARRFGQPL